MANENLQTSRVSSMVITTLIACLGAVCLGFSLGYSSSALLDLQLDSTAAVTFNKIQGSWFAVSIVISDYFLLFKTVNVVVQVPGTCSILKLCQRINICSNISALRKSTKSYIYILGCTTII